MASFRFSYEHDMESLESIGLVCAVFGLLFDSSSLQLKSGLPMNYYSNELLKVDVKSVPNCATFSISTLFYAANFQGPREFELCIMNPLGVT